MTALLLALQEPDAEQGAETSGTMMIIVIGFYLVMLLVIGLIGYRKSKGTEEDYYLAGRGQGWIVSSLTIMATFFSSFALLGAPGLVYKEGVVFALFALNVPVAGFAVYVLGNRIMRVGRARKYVTPADMICDYYDSPTALRILAALVGFLYALPYVVMQINAGGLISAVMFPNSENAFEIGVIALATVTMVYIMIGGMRSVAWSDVIQGSLLLGGMLLAGAAAVAALGGIGGFFEKVNNLPPKSLAVPGATGAMPTWKLMTICMFGSVGSMIQPAQWMRYYAARSSGTLRRSAMIFGTILPICFLFGVMLVGMGGSVLYPPVEQDGVLVPNPEVGKGPGDFDKILIVVLKNHLPELLGAVGAFLAAIIVVAIMAASMSTADSNLHAMSAVMTRDIYGRYIRPKASDSERTWVGRAVIALSTILALVLIFVGRTSEHFNPIAQIARMGFLAIAFSSQLLPITVDMLFIRKGTRAGAIAGLLAGLLVVSQFTPFFTMAIEWLYGLFDAEPSLGYLGEIRRVIDLGAFGLISNVAVFAAVSAFTRKPDAKRVEEMAGLMDGKRAE